MAANLNRDIDTVVAVDGGLSGIMYGYEAIPKEWITRLQAKDVIDATLFNNIDNL